MHTLNTVTVITPKGRKIEKAFKVNNLNDLNYITGYIQACKDRGAEVIFNDNNLTEALPV